MLTAAITQKYGWATGRPPFTASLSPNHVPSPGWSLSVTPKLQIQPSESFQPCRGDLWTPRKHSRVWTPTRDCVSLPAASHHFQGDSF